MIETKIHAISTVRQIGASEVPTDLRTVKAVVEEIMKLGVRDFLTELALVRTLGALRDALDTVDEVDIATTMSEVSKRLGKILDEIDVKLKR